MSESEQTVYADGSNVKLGKETITLYKVTCSQGYSIHDKGEGFSLTPWGEDTPYFHGFDDGGKEYLLPAGFTLAMSNGGTLEFYDKHNRCHGMMMHSSGLPQLIGGSNSCPVLKLAENE